MSIHLFQIIKQRELQSRSPVPQLPLPQPTGTIPVQHSAPPRDQVPLLLPTNTGATRQTLPAHLQTSSTAADQPDSTLSLGDASEAQGQPVQHPTLPQGGNTLTTNHLSQITSPLQSSDLIEQRLQGQPQPTHVYIENESSQENSSSTPSNEPPAPQAQG